jgi:hypothetical protein
VHATSSDADIVGCKRKSLQIVKTLVGCAQHDPSFQVLRLKEKEEPSLGDELLIDY